MQIINFNSILTIFKNSKFKNFDIIIFKNLNLFLKCMLQCNCMIGF